MPQNASLSCSEDIRAQLHRILECDHFDASERNKRFLAFAVEESLQGRADRIKAYSIATSVFGRNDSFDPQQDAIVRIEAGRLRRSLEHYYLTSGKDDPIRIEIPIGSYVPSFLRTEDMKAEATGLRSDPVAELVRRPLIQVTGFEGEASSDADTLLARSISRHVIVSLARFTDLTVIGDDPLLRAEASSKPSDFGSQEVDFILKGTAAVAEGQLHVDAMLIDARTGRFVWTDYIERDLMIATLPRLRAAVADQIVRAIAQPTGVIFSYTARLGPAESPLRSAAFDNVLRFHNYWRTFDRDEFEPVRLALEQTIISDPKYAEAFACLSQMYTNSVRFGYMGFATTLNPLRRALGLAQRAIQLSPRSSQGYLALGTAYWFSGQVSSALEAYETSRSLNPNDMEITAELGLRYALRGNWDKGIALINQAYSGNPALPRNYRIGLSLWHFVEGRYEEALSEAWKIDMPGVIYTHALVAICAAKLGRTAEADSALRSLQSLVPDYGQKAALDLQDRNLHPELIEKIVVGLQEAGLPVSARPADTANRQDRASNAAIEATPTIVRTNGN